MKLNQLAKTLEHLNRGRNGEDKVCISIQVPNSIGPSPVVEIESVRHGFDWDNGKLILIPKEPLSKSEVDNIAKIRELTKKLGWKDYENRNLKKENERLKLALNNIIKK